MKHFLALFGKPAETGVAGRETFYFALVTAAVVFLVGISVLWLIEKGAAGFGAIVVNWLYTVLTGLLVFVVFTQVGQARRSARESLEHSVEQRRKWATLQACDRYDTDPVLVEAVRYLRKYHPFSGSHRLLPPGVAAVTDPPVAVPRAELPQASGGDLTADQMLYRVGRSAPELLRLHSYRHSAGVLHRSNLQGAHWSDLH